MIAIIAAYTKNAHVIGKDGKIPWNIPEDMRRFKFLTLGNAVIFGRKTYESIGHPLEGRLNIVLTRCTDETTCTKENNLCQSEKTSLVYAKTLEDAFLCAKNYGYEKIFICGGQNVYKSALPFCDTLYLTEINKDYDGDVFFPKIDLNQFEEIERIENTEYSFITLKSKCSPLETL